MSKLPPYVLVVTGRPGSGKTTVAAAAARTYGLKYCADYVPIFALYLSRFMVKTGLDNIAASKQLSADPELKSKLDALHDEKIAEEPWFFGSMMLTSGVGVIDGIRSKAELQGIRDFCTSHGVHCEVWWIERAFETDGENIKVPVSPAWDTEAACADLVLENDTASAEEMAAWVENFIRERSVSQ